MLRYLSFLPESLLFGLHLGRFKFLTRSPRPIPPERVWELMATPPPGLRWFEEVHPTAPHLWALTGLNTLSMPFRSHLTGIKYHYDVSNDFFGLFLDSKFRFYSAAEFASPDESLEEAQERKAQSWLAMIDPRPGQRILDAGSGWGGMLHRVHQAVGGKAEVVGCTLSEEQQRYTREAFGLDVELKDFITAEYEDQSFDTIYSIETFEHVPKLELPRFAAKLRKALKPDGKLIFQMTCMPAEPPPTAGLFFGFDTFPGSEGNTLRRIITDYERAGFRPREVRLMDYRPTLRAWFTRLGARQEEAVAMVGVKNYLRYLCYLAAAWRLFESHEIYIARVVLQPG